jgi:DNA invertase Pin-like site-specific DNA recombinase
MLVGYMRVSSESDRQITDLQRDALLAVGVDGRHLFEDHASGAKDDRPGLTQALSFVRAGDVLVVWKLDRLGRSLSHLLCIVNTLKEKQVAFRSSHRRHGYHDGVGRVTVSCIRCACLV